MTYGKVSESLPFVPLILPLLIPSCTTQEVGAGGGEGGEGGGDRKAADVRALVGCNAPVGWRVLGRCALLRGSSLYVLRPSCLCLVTIFAPTLVLEVQHSESG